MFYALETYIEENIYILVYVLIKKSLFKIVFLS